MSDSFIINPMSSETHYMWLYIYVFGLNVCIWQTNWMYKFLIPCIIPRILQTLHGLSHERNSHTKKYCNHKHWVNIILSTLLSFKYETIFTSCVYSTSRIHSSHHKFPTVKGKDLSYYYTVAPRNSILAFAKCFSTPESEFISSFQVSKKLPIFISTLVRAGLITALVAKNGIADVMLSWILIRVTIMMFFFNAFHAQHVDWDNNLVPLGMNWKPTNVDFLNSLLFGKLSVEEGHGHEIHHTHPTIKPRFYFATSTHGQIIKQD
jgi:hypothetical protein